MTPSSNEGTFTAVFPDGEERTFTLQEYIDFRAWMHQPVRAEEKEAVIAWLQANNLNRVCIRISLDWWAEQPK